MKALAVIGIVLGAITAIALFAIYNAWVLSILWGWFIVPLGVKSLSIAHAYGVTLVAGLFLSTRGIKENKNQDDWISSLVTWLILPLAALFLGWIAVGFM
jgi:hypothetical protein